MIQIIKDEEKIWWSLFQVEADDLQRTNFLLLAEDIDANNHDSRDKSCCKTSYTHD